MRTWELVLVLVASCNATTRVSFGSSIQGRRPKSSLGHRTTFVSTTSGPPGDPVWDIRHLLPEANLQNNTVVNLTVQLGATAFLPCKFRDIQDDNNANEEQCLQVSWVRRRDWHILTTGLFTYTNDQRFTVLHPRDSEDWTLQIKYTTARDNGTYECQLSTGTGVSSQFVYMRVVEPRAIIVGGDLHVQRGSSIRLVCVIEQSPTPPKYVFWFHHNRMVNYDTHRGGINVTTTPGAKTLSRLTITDAQESDSGNYTCAAPNTTPDSAGVFVYYGDNTAAIQRRKSSGAWSLMVTTHFLLVASTSLLTSLVSFLVPPADSAPDPPSVRSESDPTTKAADETISHQRAEESSVTFQIAVPDWSR